MIEIHYDYHDGTEVSQSKGLELKDNFTTNYLSFFNNNEEVDDVIIKDKYDNYISRKELLENNLIRLEDDILTMLKANSFEWKNNNPNQIITLYKVIQKKFDYCDIEPDWTKSLNFATPELQREYFDKLVKSYENIEDCELEDDSTETNKSFMFERREFYVDIIMKEEVIELLTKVPKRLD